ncbi:MAG: hypothetical protein C4332_02445 [Meiothermus sp.]
MLPPPVAGLRLQTTVPLPPVSVAVKVVAGSPGKTVRVVGETLRLGPDWQAARVRANRSNKSRAGYRFIKPP